jgi:methionyl-tRNA synthetase
MATPYYLTTPIYYVNDLPHIGHIYTTTVADVLARYERMAGRDVRFLTGTDEHGQNIERAAAREGVTPLALADRVVAQYRRLRDRLDFSYDDFLRTTEPRHYRGVEEMVRRIAAAGDLYPATHEGWYCSPCETFYTDKELGREKTCPVHGTPVEWKSEQNIFFRLSRYQDRLLAWYESQPSPVRPESRLNEVRSFVQSGLRDLSVSRANLAWGIPFPGYPGQTIYVWLDALTNYVSALGLGAPEAPLYDRYWAAPDGVRLHLIGKDILRFHAVYWPAFLMSANLPLPTAVWAHGWWQRDGRKVSKSSGNVVRPDDLIDRFGADALRYFLLRDMVFGQDASFSDEAFIDRYNSDLANDLGNTVSRLVTLSRRAFGDRTPPLSCTENELLGAAATAVREYREGMDELAFQRGLESLWRLLAATNQYIVQHEPWALIKSEGASDKLSRVLWNGMEAVRVVATGLLPVMPGSARRVLQAIGSPVVETLDAMSWGALPTGAELPATSPLFPRIDKEAYMAEPISDAKPAVAAAAAAPANEPISIDQFKNVELRVGTVTAAERIPKSQKLLKLTIDLGQESRTVVAGIALAYEPEAVVGRQVVVVANLRASKLMGVESQGMVLAASEGERPVLLHPEAAVHNGTRVR